ncbi:Protein-glutamine gamma-glutamyltransferase [compost metagenome]
MVLLIAAFIIKLVELRTRRDALVLILLGFFAVVTSYLFDDSMLAALFSLLPVTVLLAALIGLQQSSFAERPWPTLKLAGGLLLQAIPLMLLLFILFPRLGPLWSLPMPGGKATTGLSDSMMPGDFVDLSQSAELAFRASFDGPPPPRTQLYWRALTLERFDGQRWSQVGQGRRDEAPELRRQGEPLSYQVIMQPSERSWLFALDTPESAPDDARLMSDFHIERRRPVDQSLLYRVTSWPQALREPDDSARALGLNLQLPAGGNPRARAWAEQLRREYPQPHELVQALLRHFNEQPFAYTLRAPATGAERIDGFLFGTRRGFCEHYAGATTFVLRAAGIPARVVTGYQGGELNPAGNYLLVHQFDAHAWVEYWQPGSGWRAIDPTFHVAPARIEQGLEQALAGEGSFLEAAPFSPLRYRGFSALNALRLAWDNLNYDWQRWVLGYQGEQQAQVLRRWFGSLDGPGPAIALLGGAALSLGLLVLLLFKPWRLKRDVQLRSFARLERLLGPHGLQRQVGEGPRAFVARARAALPEQAAELQAFIDAFEAQRYGRAAATPRELQRLLLRLRRALPWRVARRAN